jgi:hypothetical protein
VNPYQSPTAQYMRAVAAAISADVELMVTPTCQDCDRVIGMLGFVGPWHTSTQYRGQLIVVIGCEGYHHIDPASVGMPVENWAGIPGVNISGLEEI